MISVNTALAWCTLFPSQLRMNLDRGAGKAMVFT